MKERFFVIGSNSFSGASFIFYLLNENPEVEVVGVSRSLEYDDVFLPYKKEGMERFTFYQYDLNIQMNEVVELIREFEPDYIVNFSAQGMVAESWKLPEEWFATNTVAIVNLVHRIYSFSFIKRFIQISTPEVYGPCENKKESMEFFPSSPYAASKASGDLALFPYFSTHRFPLCYTRAANVYGAGQQLYRIIPRMVLSIRKGDKLPLQGEGKAIRSFIHIDDVSNATLKIARTGVNGEIYHVSDTNTVSIRDLVQNICQIMGVNIEDHTHNVPDRVGQDAIYLMNSEKIRNELEWRPKVTMGDGVRGVVAWVDENFDLLKDKPVNYIHKK